MDVVDREVDDALARSFLAELPTELAGRLLAEGERADYPAGYDGACLAAKLPYVDIANEWPAVRELLDRDQQARAHAVTLVTGAGFGPAATETLVLRLVEQLGLR